MDNLFAFVELFLDVVKLSFWSLHPWMLKNLIEGETLFRVECSHLFEKIFEFIGVNVAPLGLFMGFPKNVGSFRCKQFVVRVIFVARPERWSLCEHHENDDAAREQIDALSLVRHAQVDLWSHIVVGAHLSCQQTRAIATLNRSGKPKVRYLELVATIQQKILWLQVTMRDSILVHVLERGQQLLGVQASDWLRELPPESNEVEKLSTICKLEHNVLHLFGALLRVDLISFALLDQVDNSRVA